MLSHESREAAKKSWDAFQADPEWKQFRAASEKDGFTSRRLRTALRHRGLTVLAASGRLVYDRAHFQKSKLHCRAAYRARSYGCL